MGVLLRMSEDGQVTVCIFFYHNSTLRFDLVIIVD